MTDPARRSRNFAWLAAAVAVIVLAVTVRPWLAPSPQTAGEGTQHAERPHAGALAERRGALVDQVVFTTESDLGRMTERIKSGSHHAFGMGVSDLAVFRAVRDAGDLRYATSYGHSAELTLNPAGPRFTDGRINPFHVREIREAMNWLVDRRYIAEEIFAGLAAPRYLPLTTAFPDYARLADTARALELRYAHDPERARQVIHEQMRTLGAELHDGRWMHEGETVRLRVLTRVDDERHRIGDYVANLLEDLGFAVERMYREADEATRIWLAGDPQAGQWHVYTGAWGALYINRDQAVNFSTFYTPRGMPDPLWQAYEPDAELDELAARLQRRDYTQWDERQEMMARALQLSLEDSVRIWLVDQLSVWPRAANVDVSVDLAAGVAGSHLWPYTLRFADRLGGRVLFGVPTLLTEPWNPVAGTTTLYDNMIQRAVEDMVVVPDPFTGLFHPQRLQQAQVTVQEDVPVNRTLDWVTLQRASQIDVPEDAWIGWHSREQRWIPVAERHPAGITARTRVVVHYEEDFLQRYWHDGTRVSLADLVLPWILTFERADESSRLFDPSAVPAFEVFREHFRGWRIVSRDPLVVEIYSDQIFPDAELIVANRAPNVLPWHSLSVAVLAEQAGELAFSSSKADRQRVDWLSLVAGPSLAVLDRHLERARAGSRVPFGQALETHMRTGEIEQRYAALQAWRARHRHFLIGSGPFYLRSVHPVERTVVLNRFEDFPDPADKWLHFTEPPIPELDLDGPLVVEAGDEAHFELRITFGGEPYPEESLEAARYLLFDHRGNLVADGDAAPRGPGAWSIELTADQLAALGRGASSLEVAVTSREVALPAFASHVFATLPEGESP